MEEKIKTSNESITKLSCDNPKKIGDANIELYKEGDTIRLIGEINIKAKSIMDVMTVKNVIRRKTKKMNNEDKIKELFSKIFKI